MVPKHSILLLLLMIGQIFCGNSTVEGGEIIEVNLESNHTSEYWASVVGNLNGTPVDNELSISYQDAPEPWIYSNDPNGSYANYQGDIILLTRLSDKPEPEELYSPSESDFEEGGMFEAFSVFNISSYDFLNSPLNTFCNPCDFMTCQIYTDSISCPYITLNQDFDMGVLKFDNGTHVEPVFVTTVNNQEGYNTSFFDYEFIMPVGEGYYFYLFEKGYTEPPPPPPEDMDIEYEFICPGNEVLFTAMDGGDPLSDVDIEIYILPSGDFVNSLNTNSEGQADVELTEEAEYEVFADKDDYYAVDFEFDFDLCPEEPECEVDEDCFYDEKCSQDECVEISCPCGVIENHTCIEYDCCSDDDCPVGSICIDRECIQQYECISDDDCAETEYCNVTSGEEGGSCEDVVGCGEVADHQLIPYECGDSPYCLPCPSGTTCKDHECVEVNITCPESGEVGTGQICTATEGDEPCIFCNVAVTNPDGTIGYYQTDDEGKFSFTLENTGDYDVSLMENETPLASITVLALARTVGGEAKPFPLMDYYEPVVNYLLPILAILLLLLILFLLWRRKNITVEIISKKPERGVPLNVRTIDKGSKKAIKGVPIMVDFNGKPWLSGKTDEKGGYSFKPDASGRYEIFVMGRDKPEQILRL